MPALILGGSRGIGRAISVGLAGPDMDIFVNYATSKGDAEATRQAIEERGARAYLVPGDIATPAGAAEVLARVSEHARRLDVLVHCAVSTASGSLLSADPIAFKRAVDVNAMSLLYAVQSALPLLGEGSSVIFLSSRGARMALKNYASVGAPKALAEAFIRYLAVELAPRGARANIISPTALDTSAFRSIFPHDADERLKQAARDNPSGRIVNFDDVVDAVRFLASPASSMIQGQNIVLDGGGTLVG